MKALVEAIRGKNKGVQEDFIAQMEAKYAVGKKKKVQKPKKEDRRSK